MTPPESCLSTLLINFSYDPNSSFLAIKYRKTQVDLKTSGMLNYYKVAFGQWRDKWGGRLVPWNANSLRPSPTFLLIS